jgi:hypothetical protein
MPLEAQGKTISFRKPPAEIIIPPLIRCSFDRILTEGSKEMIEALPNARCLDFDQVHIGTPMIKSSNNILKNLSISIFLQQREPTS